MEPELTASAPETVDDAPQPELAGEIVQALVGVEPAGVRRFASGTDHFVFEVTFTVRKPLVVRMTTPDRSDEMASAARLSRRLRQLGVPLPSILAVNLNGPFPYTVLQRLPGVDLGMAMRGLSDDALRDIAGKVAAAQAVVAHTPTAGQYGYAAVPDEAPHATWSNAIIAMLDRVRWRMAEAGLYDPGIVDTLDWIVLAAREELDRQPATPFLHDTTTKNVIVTLDGAFSGIVDVDDLCFGDPRLAAALTQASIIVGQKPNAYVDHWLAATGQAADRVFNLYVALFLLDFMAEHGHASNGDQPASDPEERERLRAIAEDHIAPLNAEWGMG